MVADFEDNTPPRKKAKMASNGAATHSEMAIDEDLHSRQLAVYGRESMRRMAASSIMVVGLKGLGVEIGERAHECIDDGRGAEGTLHLPQGDHSGRSANALCPAAAKNIILAGVKRVVLHDVADVHISDLGANFYLSETDVGRNRAEACLDRLRELNTAVAVDCVSGNLTDSQLTDVDVRALPLPSAGHALKSPRAEDSACANACRW